MLTRERLASYGWSDDHVTDLALEAARTLAGAGLDQDAILVWLDQVRAEPGRYLSDPELAPLARSILLVQAPQVMNQFISAERAVAA